MQFWYFFVQIIGKIILRPVVRIFFKIETAGREMAEAADGPLIITPNHKSYIDHFIIVASLPWNLRLFPIRAMADIAQMRRPIIGPCIKILGGFTARTKGKNLDELFEVPVEVLKDKGVVLLYPEGSIFKDANIHPAKTGAAELGLRTSAKYLPVAISGLDNFLLTDLPRLIFARRKIRISFGKVFRPEHGQNRKELARKIEEEIRTLYDSRYHQHSKHPS